MSEEFLSAFAEGSATQKSDTHLASSVNSETFS